jgi:hypothetical protein
MLVTIINDNKTKVDLTNLLENTNLKVINIDEDSHKDFVFAKKLLYKWGSPKLPFCTIEEGKKTLYVMYSEKEVVDASNINEKLTTLK